MNSIKKRTSLRFQPSRVCHERCAQNGSLLSTGLYCIDSLLPLALSDLRFRTFLDAVRFLEDAGSLRGRGMPGVPGDGLVTVGEMRGAPRTV